MGRICRALGKQDASYSTPISPAQEGLGVGASDWGPCPGLTGWSQGSPRVPAEGSEFLLLVCCPGDWKPHHPPLRAGPHRSNPLCQTSLGHCHARDWVSGATRESGPQESSHTLQGSLSSGEHCSVVGSETSFLRLSKSSKNMGYNGSDRKEPACNAGDPDLTPGSGRSPGEGNENPLQYSRLENPMDRGTWRATVHRIAKSWTRQ